MPASSNSRKLGLAPVVWPPCASFSSVQMEREDQSGQAHQKSTAALLDDAALGSCMLFRELTSKERAALVTRVTTRRFAPGDTIFLMGSTGDSMMAVLSGSVRISVSSPEGKELTLAIVQKGEVFGEIALLDRKERTADATALTACKLAILERRDIQSFCQDYPAALLKIVDILCLRFRHADQHIAELALLPLSARLAKVLLRMPTERQTANDRARWQIQLSQRELGALVGVSRESINKCLSAWQNDGIVRIGKNLITILDREAFEGLAQAG